MGRGKSATEGFEGVLGELRKKGAAQLRLGRRPKVWLVLLFVVFSEDELIPRDVDHVHDVETPSTLDQGSLSLLRKSLSDVLKAVASFLATEWRRCTKSEMSHGGEGEQRRRQAREVERGWKAKRGRSAKWAWRGEANQPKRQQQRGRSDESEEGQLGVQVFGMGIVCHNEQLRASREQMRPVVSRSDGDKGRE